MLPSHFKGTFIDLIPDTGPGFIHIAFLGSGSATGTIAHSFGALHGTYKGSFLKQAIATHPAAKHGTFDPSLYFS
jgi:hypothetical protein